MYHHWGPRAGSLRVPCSCCCHCHGHRCCGHRGHVVVVIAAVLVMVVVAIVVQLSLVLSQLSRLSQPLLRSLRPCCPVRRSPRCRGHGSHRGCGRRSHVVTVVVAMLSRSSRPSRPSVRPSLLWPSQPLWSWSLLSWSWSRPLLWLMLWPSSRPCCGCRCCCCPRRLLRILSSCTKRLKKNPVSLVASKRER